MSFHPLNSKTYYEILNLTRRATCQDIKERFYVLSKQWHPDKHGGSQESHKKFQELNEAYSILINREERQKYDRYLGGMRMPSLEMTQTSTLRYKKRDEGFDATMFKSPFWIRSSPYSSPYEMRYMHEMFKKAKLKEEMGSKSTSKYAEKGDGLSHSNKTKEEEEENNQKLQLVWLVLLLICMGYGNRLRRKMG
jgi:curved DNA-binding protein CbpA